MAHSGSWPANVEDTTRLLCAALIPSVRPVHPVSVQHRNDHEACFCCTSMVLSDLDDGKLRNVGKFHWPLDYFSRRHFLPNVQG